MKPSWLSYAVSQEVLRHNVTKCVSYQVNMEGPPCRLRMQLDYVTKQFNLDVLIHSDDHHVLEAQVTEC